MKTLALICATLTSFASSVGGQATNGAAKIKLATEGLPATNRVTGQIVLTQNNGETVKLDPVTVWVIDAKKFSTAMDRTLIYQAAKKNDAEWRARAKTLADTMPRMSKTNREIAKNTYATLSAQIKSNLPMVQLADRSAYQILEGLEKEWKSERRFQTDAHGNFSMLLPDGPWVIAARARRRIFSLEEKYAWTAPLTTPETQGPILLNNSNLMK